MESTIDPERADPGTPRDYSESMYRLYLELADCSHATRRLIEDFLPQHHAARIVDLDYGFEFEMPIQCAPDLVRNLKGWPGVARGSGLDGQLSRATNSVDPGPTRGDSDQSDSQESRDKRQGKEKAFLQHIVLIDVAVKGPFQDPGYHARDQRHDAQPHEF